MNRPARRILGLLPLVASLGLAGAWVATNASSRRREQTESSIRLRWEAPAEAAGVEQEIGAYLERYGGDPSAAWFAVETRAHLRDLKGALDLVTSRADLREEKGAARRLARLLIEPLRRRRGVSDMKTPLTSRLMHVLLEAQDPDAMREWADLSAHLSTPEAMTLFVPASRTPSRGTQALGTALAARTDDRELRAAGAILLASPRHVDDVPFLLELFRSSWRVDRRPTWQNIVRALGTTGDPRALEAFRGYVDKPSGDAQMPTASTVVMGLALAGDAEAKKLLLADLHAPGAPRLLSLYGMGLATRLSHGDESAIPRLAELWDASPDPMLRFQLAEAVLVADPAPPAAFPAEQWVNGLLAADGLLFRTLAHAWRLRTGADTPFTALGADLAAATALFNIDDPRSPEEIGPGVLVEVLRAWMRWGG